MRNDGEKQGSAEKAGAVVHATDTRETTDSLELAIAQIDMALEEADNSFVELIGAVTSMASYVNRIEAKLGDLRQIPDALIAAEEIEKNCRQVEVGMQQAVTAFQFYDRLSQRFLHIHENLGAVADVMKAPDQQHPALWHNLHKKLRSVYSLEQEQHLYQNLVDGLPVEEAGSESGTKINTEKNSGDIELF